MIAANKPVEPALDLMGDELSDEQLDCVVGGTRSSMFSMLSAIVDKFDESTKKVIEKLGQ